MPKSWSPESWKQKTASQQPIYADQDKLDKTLKLLSLLPPLVTSWEVESLKDQLAAASKGNAFLLQAGDCCENLDACEGDSIVRNLKVLMQMSFVLAHGSTKKVIRVGRIAGQYAKPRSADTETRDGVTLPVYRGDIINRSGFSAEHRQSDPDLLLRGYERAALTLNFIRGLCVGGFADLRHPENWELEFSGHSPRLDQYHDMVRNITGSLKFMEAVLGPELGNIRSVEVYTSHEGLHLSYEQAQTTMVPRRNGWYNLSTHFPWIGYRTRDIDGAHVEYFRGIVNPIGLKVGPNMDRDELTDLIAILNPDNEPGRLTLIHRMGATEIEQKLPNLIDAVKRKDQVVTWCSDPMHGNTYVTENGIKTRRFDDVLSELLTAFSVHHSCGSILGGVHLELTGENVTECVGGSANVAEPDLEKAYKSSVDPRLNYDQAMEMAFLISEHMQN
jgi:3-deoxy-7-phosphoheptulonate synthase